MLIKLRFGFPEIVFGMLLAVALFAMGALFRSSQYPGQPAQTQSAEKSDQATHDKAQPKNFWEAATTDPVATFTAALVIVGLFQAGLFFVQLKLIRISLDDAKEVAEATTDAAIAATKQAKIAEDSFEQLERPYIFVFGLTRLQADVNGIDYFVAYNVANYGKLPAIIDSISVGFETSDNGEPGLPTHATEGHELVVSPVMPNGDRRNDIPEYLPTGMAGDGINVLFPDIRNPEIAEFAPVFNIVDNHDMFFRVRIEYRSPVTENHVTDVFWLFDNASLRFVQRRQIYT
jgi:hypothetical protein